jgi:CheY-like chemotaxis protein
MPSPSLVASHRLPYALSVPAFDFPTPRRSLHSYIPAREPLECPVGPAAVAVYAMQTRVLIADETSSAGQLTRLLHGLGYWLTKTASSGASALALAQDFRPSIVLIALDLPDMSARYIARRVRERTAMGQVRLIALADDCSLASRDRVCDSGLLRYLTKPVSTAALQQALRTGTS